MTLGEMADVHNIFGPIR